MSDDIEIKSISSNSSEDRKEDPFVTTSRASKKKKSKKRKRKTDKTTSKKSTFKRKKQKVKHRDSDDSAMSDTSETKETSFDRKEENIDVNTDERMELERILRNFGGGTGFDNFGGYGFGSRLSKQRVDEILKALKSDNEMIQLEAVTELCNFFSVSTQDSVQSARVELFIPHLVTLLRKFDNVQLSLMAARSLTHIMDCLPPIASLIVQHGGIDALCQTLMNPEYIDLVEQSIQCLYHLSQTYGPQLLKSGVLGASLMYIDFFAINIQRTVIQMAVNICKRISRDTNFDDLREPIQSLINCLMNPDQKIKENAIIAITNIVNCCSHDAKKVEEICTDGLLERLNSLIEPSNVDQRIFSLVMILLTNLCRGSHNVVKKLHESGIAIMLQGAFDSESIKSSQNSPSIQSSINDVLTLLHSLLPRIDKDHTLVTNMTPSQRNELFLNWAYPTESTEEEKKQLHFIGFNRNFIQRIEEIDKNLRAYYEDNTIVLLNFGQCIIPSLMQVFSSNLIPNIRYKCLSIIGTILYFGSGEVLKQMLENIPISTFIAGLLSSNDMTEVATAIQIAEDLMKKLPDIFRVYFPREGVLCEIQKLSGLKEGDTSPGLLELMKVRAKKAMKKAEKQRAKKLEQLKKEEELRYNREMERYKKDLQRYNEEQQKEKEKESKKKKKKKKKKDNVEDAKPIWEWKNGGFWAPYDEDLSKQLEEAYQNDNLGSTKITIHSQEYEIRFSDMIQENLNSRYRRPIRRRMSNEDPESFSQKKKHMKKPKEPVKRSISLPFEKPFVEIPPIPKSSRLSQYSRDKSKDIGLVGYVVAKAQEFQRTYFNETDVSKYDSPIASKMRALGKQLISFIDSPDPRAEENVLKEIGNILFNPEGISNFEFLNSGVIHGLYSYLTTKTNDDKDGKIRMERVLTFCKVFTTEVEEVQDTAPVSPLRSPVRGAKQIYCLELIQRLQSCLSSVAQFPLIVDEGQSLLSSINNAFRALTREIRICLKEHGKKMDKKIANVAVSSLARVEDLEVYFLIKKRKKEEMKKRLKKSKRQEKDDEMDITEPIDEYKEEEIPEDYETEYISDMNHDTLGFTLDEYVEGEEDFSNVRKDVFEVKKPDEKEDKYSFLFEQQEDQSMEEEENLEEHDFYINDNKLDPGMTILNAIYTYGNYRKDGSTVPIHPRNLYITDQVHVITYKKKESKETKESEIIPKIQIGYSKLDDLLDSKLTEFNFIDKNAYECIELLKVINGLTDIEYCIQKMRELIPKQVFINSKITNMLARQVQDPWMLFTDSLPNWCFDIVTKCPFLLPFESRREFFELTSLGLARSMKNLENKIPKDLKRNKFIRSVRIDRLKVKIDRERILEYAYRVLNLYGLGNEVLEYEYYDEVGTGLGPTLEFYTLVSREFQSPKLGIWRDESTEEREYVFAPRGLFPKPISPTSDATAICRIFEFLGLFIARSIYDSRLLDMSFSETFLKILVGKKLEFSDLENVDPLLYRQLVDMKQLVQQKHLIEKKKNLSEKEKKKRIESLKIKGKKIEDAMLDFTIGDIELKPNGSEIDVTIWNLEEYIDLTVNMILKDGIERQIEAFKRGFNKLLDIRRLSIFSAKELDEILCGDVQKWSVETLMEATRVENGFTKSSKTIQDLFKILSEMNREEQRLFLQFVTGCPKLPIGGLANLHPKLTIVRKIAEKGQSPDSYLPSAMTCTNFLKLPDYSNITVLREQLFKAIREGQGSFLLS